MKKFLIFSALILSLTIIFIACSEERDHASPFDPAYWDSDVPSLTDFIIENTAIDTIKLSWTNTAELPERYSYRIDKKVGSVNWIVSYKQLASNIKTCKDYVEINQTISYRAFIIYDENTSDKKEKVIENTFPAPSDLIASQTSITSANLSWNDNSIGEEKFEIERKLSTESAFIKIADVTGSDTEIKTYSDITLELGKTYDYRVRAVKAIYSSAYFNSTGYLNDLNLPTDLSITQNNVYTFSLIWIDSNIGEDGFKIERKIDDGVFTEIKTTTETTFIDSTIAKKSYNTVYYRVRAYKGSYYSGYASNNSALTFPAPSELNVSQTSLTSAKITWMDNSIGEDKFEIERKLSIETSYAKVGEIPGNDISTKIWTDATLEPTKIYDYRVKAVNGINSSAFVTKTGYLNSFNSPNSLGVIQNNVYTFTLSWTDSNIGEDGFKIERKIDDGTWSEIKTTTATVLVDSTVAKKGYGTIYYQVRSYKDTYFSTYSTTNSTVVFPAPTNLTYSKENINTIEINWQQTSNGEDGFKIDKKIGTENWSINYATVGEDVITWTDSNADINQTLEYRIYAYKGSNTTAIIATPAIDNTFSPPTNLTSYCNSVSSITLTWTDNSKGEQGFKIDRKISEAGTWEINYATVGIDVNTFTDNGLLTGTNYYYRVRAYYQESYSNYSNEVYETQGFVPISSGSFSMGQIGVSEPVHTVNISKAYYLGKYEVTQKEWTDVMGSNPSVDHGVGDNYPVYYVSWYAILVYCNRRSIIEGLTPCYTINSSTNPDNWGSIPTSSNSTWDTAICNFSAKGYRLPTEAEWEHAVRYNDGRTYPWGGTVPSDALCNYNGNVGAATAVGSYLSGNSKLGLCDIAGNAWESVWDWNATYPSTEQTDPLGPTTTQTNRVIRGGGWNFSYTTLKCAARSGIYPFTISMSFGFRLARTK